jgi:hypothetical protein
MAGFVLLYAFTRTWCETENPVTGYTDFRALTS